VRATAISSSLIVKDCFDAKHIPVTRDSVGQDEKPSSDEDSLTYIDMSLLANELSAKYNILAVLCSWLILAGYVVVSRAFTLIKDSETLSNSKAGKVVQNTNSENIAFGTGRGLVPSGNSRNIQAIEDS